MAIKEKTPPEEKQLEGGQPAAAPEQTGPETAQAAPPEVHVRMKKTEGELVISVRNRVRQNVEIPEGQLPRSTKREPGHGMGLANVCAVLEAHNAEYTLSCRDNWFRFTCAFPTNGL